MLMRKILSLNINVFIYCIILYSYFPAPYLHIIFPQIASVESIVKILAVVYCLQYLVRRIDTYKSSFLWKYVIFIFLFIFVLGFSSIYNHASISAYAQFVWLILGGVVVFVVAIDRDLDSFIRAVIFLFGTYTLLNLLSCIFSPSGLYSSITTTGELRTEASYFLGHKNVMIQYMLYGLICLGAQNILHSNKSKNLTLVYCSSILICNIIGQSTTSIIATLIIFVGIFFCEKKWVSVVFSPISIVILQVGFFVCIVLLNLQSYFSYFLLNVTGKGLDMNGRTEIWDIGLNAFFAHPILGHGIDSTDSFLRLFSMNNDSFHNFVLDILFQGGIIGLVVSMCPLVLLHFDIQNISQIRLKSFLCCILFASSIIWLSQPVTRTRMMFVYFPVLLTLIFIKRASAISCRQTIETNQVENSCIKYA